MKKRKALKFHHEVNKMGTHSYKKRRNASVISFSPAFNEAIRVIRSGLGLPAGGFSSGKEREKWYKRHHTENMKESYRPMPRHYWHFPKEFVELIHSFTYSSEPSRVNYYPDVPLDRRAMELVRKFELPEDVVDQVKACILSDTGSLGIGPALQPIVVPVNEGEEGIKYVVLVAGIDEASTQKDWVDVWKRLEIVLRLSGIGKAPHKRPIDEVFLRDLGFWKRIRERKTAKQILDEWIKRHPEDVYLGEDTVRKAVERIDSIMRPDL